MLDSAAQAEQTRSVPAFAAVQLDASDDVTVRVGGEPSVVVRGDDNRLDRVTTEVEDGTLVIGRRGFFGRGTSFAVEITVPALESIALHGSGTVRVDGLDEPSLIVALPGSGTITAGGTVDVLEVTLSGSGEVQLQDLVARAAVASVAGSGRISVNATETLDASVSGSGTITYTGSPTVTSNITGSGAVTQQ